MAKGGDIHIHSIVIQQILESESESVSHSFMSKSFQPHGL